MKPHNQSYVVTYRDPKDGELTTLKAKKITDSSLGLSFIALSDFVFETSSILVDPQVESRKAEFENINTFHLSIYSVVSIAEVGEHLKPLSFANDKGKLVVLHQDNPPQPPH